MDDFVDPTAVGAQQPVTPSGSADRGFVDPTRQPAPGAAALPTTARPILQSMDRGADVSDIAVASLANETQARIRYYAQQMGIPQQRFGVREGQIFYEGDDGGLHAVVPEGDLIGRAARGLGATIPAIGGMGGALLGTAVGPWGTMAGGALGASGGQYVREGLAANIMDQEVSHLRAATEGAYDLAGGAVGAMIMKGLGKAAAIRAGKKINDMIKSGKFKADEAIDGVVADLNKRYGTSFQLTPGEITENAYLLTQQRSLAARPETLDKIVDFYVSRANEAGTMVGKQLDELSPHANLDEGGRQLSQAAQDAVQQARKTRTAKGSPLYTKAFEDSRAAGGVDMTPVLHAVEKQWKMGSKQLRAALDEVREEIISRELGSSRKIISDPEVIQNTVKELLDDKIGAAIRGGQNKLANRLISISDDVVKALDDQVPGYQNARKVWRELSADIDEVAGGALPQLAKATSKDFEQVGVKFLGKTSPSEISRIKGRILAAGGEDAWNSTLRGFLQGQWDKAGREYFSGLSRPDAGRVLQPAKYWAALRGDTTMAARLQAAMTPEQWGVFRDITDAFRQTGTAAQLNSTTAAQLIGQGTLEGGGMSQAAKGAGGLISMSPLQGIANWQHRWRTGANAESLVGIITSPDAIKILQNLGKSATKPARQGLIASRVLSMLQTQYRAQSDGDT
jgi:hypothetical protein